jgi:hypothetical protein
MSSFFDFFTQPSLTSAAHSGATRPVNEVALPKANGRNLTVADVLKHGPVTVTIAGMDGKGASAIVTNAGSPELLGSSFRFEAKTPCIKRASIQMLAKMRERSRVTLACAGGKGNAPLLTITDVS